ncbi:MAG: DUF805 domain-containing protein [Alphaproteobacteria bacterium]
MKNLFFSIHGRIGRQQFWLGFLAISLFIFAGNNLLRALGQSMTGFYISLFFPFFSIYVLYCLYGKRLHDMGRSTGPFFAMIAAECVAIIIVMMMFGGSEYFAEFSQFERKEAIDPAITQEIISRYQAKISANMNVIQPLLKAVPLLFTLWVGAAKGQRDTNKYGPPL